MNKKILVISFLTLILNGCASPKVVEEVQVNDDQLSCREIEDQIAEAKRFEDKARDEKGVTGTNVAAALLFWPAMFVTYGNANEAIEAADERRRHLQTIYTRNNCGDGVMTASNTDKEDLSKKIMEINELYKQGALTEEEYTAAKRKVLGL